MQWSFLGCQLQMQRKTETIQTTCLAICPDSQRLLFFFSKSAWVPDGTVRGWLPFFVRHFRGFGVCLPLGRLSRHRTANGAVGHQCYVSLLARCAYCAGSGHSGGTPVAMAVAGLRFRGGRAPPALPDYGAVHYRGTDLLQQLVHDGFEGLVCIRSAGQGAAGLLCVARCVEFVMQRQLRLLMLFGANSFPHDVHSLHFFEDPVCFLIVFLTSPRGDLAALCSSMFSHQGFSSP